MTIHELGDKGRVVKNDALNPHQRCHEWRRYIPPELKAIWYELTDEARGVAVLMAEERADAEEWE